MTSLRETPSTSDIPLPCFYIVFTWAIVSPVSLPSLPERLALLHGVLWNTPLHRPPLLPHAPPPPTHLPRPTSPISTCTCTSAYVRTCVRVSVHEPRERERERGRVRMIYSFRPLPLRKGCRWMTYHLTVHTIITSMNKKTNKLTTRERLTD